MQAFRSGRRAASCVWRSAAVAICAALAMTGCAATQPTTGPRAPRAAAPTDRAVSLLESGRPAEAERLLAGAIPTAGGHERATLERLRAASLVSLDRPVEAAEIYERLLSADAADLESWIGLGHASFMLGHDTRLGEAATASLALAPDRPEPHTLAALHLRAGGDPLTALIGLERAPTAVKRDASVRTMRAMLLADIGLHDRAVRELETMLTEGTAIPATIELLDRLRPGHPSAAGVVSVPVE